MKNNKIEQQYWNNFYKKYKLQVPSQFCLSVITDDNTNKAIVEFGMGNGRDALYFASQGIQIIAVDISNISILECQQKKIDNAFFMQGDISDIEVVSSAIDNARKTTQSNNIIVYSRFVMHSLDKIQENNFLSAISQCMKKDDKVYFEFRADKDEDTQKYYGNTNHFRRYIEPNAFIESLKQHKFDIIYNITGKGMAKFKNEDPVVTRITAVKS